MLEILQARDYKKYIPIIEKLNIDDDLISVVEAVDKNEVLGYGIYRFEDAKLIIEDVECNDDFYLLDGIIRSILYLAMSNGIDSAVFNVSGKYKTDCQKIINTSQNCIESISTFMNNCKNCNKK